MKKIFTLLAASVASLGLNAQITISQSDYAGWKPGTESFRDADTAFSFPMTAGANWDITPSVLTGTYTRTYSPFTNSALPGASFSYMADYRFSALSYESEIACNISANGIEEIGESIPWQGIDISALTRKAGDSLIFPAQVVPYSASRLRLSFQTTYNKTWTSNFNRSTNFSLKYSGMPFSGARKSYGTQIDSVNGWGRVRVKRLDGSNSGWIDVLVVKTSVLTVDSFSLVGQPDAVLNQLLRGFGLSQGMRDSTQTISLYRKGEVSALVTVGCTDTTYRTADYTTVHQSRIPENVSVGQVPAAASLKLFPNPATATSGFDIELTETAAGTWSYNLLDASGKIVSSAVIAPNSTKAHINAAQAAPGMYFLNLQNNGQPVATKPVTIK